jgi:hypothetical protein
MPKGLEALKYLEEHGRFSAPTIYQTWDQMTDSGHTVCSALSTQPVGSVRKELLDASRTEEYPLPEAEAELIVDMTITAATAPGSLCPR